MKEEPIRISFLLNSEEHKLLRIEAGRRKLDINETAYLIVKTYLHGIYEDVLASPTRRRILATLYRLGRVNLTRLAKLSRCTPYACKENLDILESIGLVECHKYGERIKMYNLNMDNPKTRGICEFIEKWYVGGEKLPW